MWCLLTLGRERLEEKQVVTGCQSQFKPCPRQPDCIFDLLPGDCGHDMTVKCAIQHLAGPFGFKDVLLNPVWVILRSPHLFPPTAAVLQLCGILWSGEWNKGNGNQRGITGNGLADDSITARAKHEQIHSYWVSLLWTHKGGFCASKTAVSGTNTTTLRYEREFIVLMITC